MATIAKKPTKKRKAKSFMTPNLDVLLKFLIQSFQKSPFYPQSISNFPFYFFI